MVIPSDKPALSNDPVADVTAYLATPLQEIEQLLHDVIQSDSPLVREVGDYICLTNGKKLRPIMTLLMSRAFGSSATNLPVKIAAALETIHVASLLHDDVIDKAPLRRGKPSVNARWGDDVAILMADYLFASAFDLVLDQLQPESLRLICQVTRGMSEGEMYQIERRGRWLTRQDYLNIIQCKTAYLFSAGCALGAMSAGLPLTATAQAADFGLNFGMAFQITDDALDYVATNDHWGKSLGLDLAAGKQTLPLILAMESATPEDRNKIEAVMNNGRDFTVIEGILERYGAIKQSLEVAQNYAAQAAGRLGGISPTDDISFDFLLSLTNYVISRRF